MSRRLKNRSKVVAEDHVQCQVCGHWFEQITISHLRLHDMTTTNYKERFGKLTFASLALRRTLSETNRRLPTKPDASYSPWLPDEIIAEIRQRKKAGGAARGWRINRALAAQAARVFGSCGKALAAAGITPFHRPAQEWTAQSVAAALREWAGKSRTLRIGRLQRSDYRLYAAMLKFYGPAPKAGQALGLKMELLAPRWSKEKVTASVRHLAARGQSLATMAMRRKHAALHHAACQQFGSWQSAVDAAGFDLADWNQRKPGRCLCWRKHFGSGFARTVP